MNVRERHVLSLSDNVPICCYDFSRNGTGFVNSENHALSNMNPVVSASNAKIERISSGTTEQSPSPQDLVKPSQNSSQENIVEKETNSSASGENSQSGGSRDKLNSDSHETEM